MPSTADESAERHHGEADAAALPVLRLGAGIAIEPMVAGDVRVCASVGPAGELVAVWAQIEHLPVAESWVRSTAGARFPNARAPRTISARVSVHSPDVVSVVTISSLDLANFTAQPLPGGNILLVGCRCYWRPEGADRNAVVYGADGRELAREVLGDGIAHLLADTAGHVWAGYTDEGIYGNYGWGFSGPEPVGAPGLVRFSPDLKAEWRFPNPDAGDFGTIDECHALNVDGTTAWTSYDSDYPVARVRDGHVDWWRCGTWASALAVDGTRAALYRPTGQLITGGLTDGRFTAVASYRIALPGGAAVPSHTEVIGRGPVLHFITDDYWYQLSLRDVAA